MCHTNYSEVVCDQCTLKYCRTCFNNKHNGILTHTAKNQKYEFKEATQIEIKQEMKHLELDYNNNLEIFKELMKNGPSKSFRDQTTGDTPIQLIANMENSKETVNYMTEFLKDPNTKVDINIQNSLTGETALHLVTKKTNVDLTKILLNPQSVSTIYDQGANPLITDNKGRTSVDILVESKEPKSEVIAQMFLKFSGTFQADLDNQLILFEKHEKVDLRKAVILLKLDGVVTRGDIDVVLSWTGKKIDLDLIVFCPHGEKLNCFGSDITDDDIKAMHGIKKCLKCEGQFDLDANACTIYQKNLQNPTEHVFWKDMDKIKGKNIRIEIVYQNYHDNNSTPENARFYLWLIKKDGTKVAEEIDVLTKVKDVWKKEYTIPN